MRGCPIVGIGASAGGLEAFSELVAHLPVDTDMAFVLVQHMDRSHESLLPQLIAKVTSMPVQQVRDDMKVEPNQIYVIPPNASMTLSGGSLRLHPRPETVQHMVIDRFFRSLAEEHLNKAIGVILSGTGSDGVLGLTAIKAHGGIVFAQDEPSAKFNGMPRSAFASGVVDFVSSPEGIAKELTRIGCHPYVTHTAAEEGTNGPDQEKSLERIFGALRASKGIDFTYYKLSTFHRRLSRRMAVHRLKDIREYAEFLKTHPEEIDALAKDVLIHVTRFFRDPAVFEALVKTVFPALLKDRPKGAPIRIWVPGCSTGEEAYSIAIALLEFMGDANFPIQLFATDISDDVISKARMGQFLENIADDLSPERLSRYFEKWEGGYKISKAVRALCTFARHNMITDPPFSRMDLISCRNVVIYWDPILHKRLIPLFHYALNPDGFLVLGTSESARSYGQLFEPADEEQQIYSKKPAARRSAYLSDSFPYLVRSMERKAAPGIPAEPGPLAPFDAPLEADHITRKLYSPPALLVNNDLEIIQFRGPISPYIGPLSGRASLQLLQMVSQDLGKDLSMLIDLAREKDVAVHKSDRQMEVQGQWKPITIRVFPIKGMHPKQRFFLIMFEAKTPGPAAWDPHQGPERRAAPPAPSAAALDSAQLRQKLFAMEAHLQSILERSDILNEELRSANEEILSANEELQASNEELETTKEELQSTNEELMTLNSELQSSSDDAHQARDRSRMIIDTVRQPLLVLDQHMRVLEANQTFLTVYHLSTKEVSNQLLYDIQEGQWNIPDLRELLGNILPRQQAIKDYEITHEFPTLGRRRMLLNARQVLKSNGTPDRILLSMEDITERERVRDRLEGQNRDLQQLSQTLETRVDERSRELEASQKALQHARQLEAIGRLAGGVAHDFNNLMTGILGMAEDLRGDLPADGHSQENVAAIVQAAQKACALTKQLLAFGRRQVFRPEIVNLNQIVSDAKPLYQRFVGENTQFVLSLAPDTATIRGDQSQIEQILLNLIINSRDAMPRGGQVIIETQNVDVSEDMRIRHFDLPPGGYVRLTISDTGLGMDVETLHRIFEPFFTTKESGKGTGLGLATTYGIVKQHGGDISVYSEPGQGTTFKIYFPRVDATAREDPSSTPLLGGVSGGETILVVEDEDIVRRVATKALRKSGYNVLEAKNGEDAIRVALGCAEPIDLLVTDVIMPGINGRDLAEKLKVNKPAMKVLYMSGYPHDVIVSRGMLNPGIAFIEKSFSRESLCRKVRAVLDGSDDNGLADLPIT